MKKLNLPVVKWHSSNAKQLSMDDYLKFVNLCLKCGFDRKANRRWKKMLAVNVQFFINKQA